MVLDFLQLDITGLVFKVVVRIALFLIVLIVFFIFSKYSKKHINFFLSRKSHVPQLSSFLSETYFYIVNLTGLVLGLLVLGLRIQELFATLAIFGIAVGFAARNTIENFISGLIIFWDKPFYLGDYIEVGKYYGRVAEITLRSTRIRTNKNEYIIIPNSEITNSQLINHSKKGAIRIEVPITIDYNEDIEKVRNVLLSVLAGDKRINREPKPDVTVEELGEYGVKIKLRFWINDISREKRIKREFTEKAKLALDKNGIEIPYPHMVIKKMG